jgi:hypothetical protein
MSRILAAVVCLALAGCGGGTPAAPPQPTREAAPAPPSTPVVDAGAPPRDAIAPVVLAPDEALTAETLERLLSSLAGCGFDDVSGALDCDEARAVFDAMREHAVEDSDAQAAMEKEVALRLLTHASPAVRYVAFEILFYTHPTPAWMSETVLGETDRDAHFAMGAQTCNYAVDPALSELLVALLKTKDVRLRRVCAKAMNRGYQITGAYDVLAAMVTGDDDDEVRRHACRSIGGLRNDAAVGLYKKVLVGKTEPALYDDCLWGLLDMWVYRPGSAAAYELTLEVLRKGPYRKGAPSYQLYRVISYVPENLEDDPRSWDDRPWMKLADVGKALAAVARSDDADPELRQALEKNLSRFGQ